MGMSDLEQEGEFSLGLAGSIPWGLNLAHTLIQWLRHVKKWGFFVVPPNSPCWLSGTVGFN